MKLKRRLLRKIGIGILLLFSVAFGILLYLFYAFSSPKTDKEIFIAFEKYAAVPKIYTNNYQGFSYRVVAMQQQIDTTLPSLLFVHGSPGSAMDFKRYLGDAVLRSKANIFAYDRIGYGTNQTGNVQTSITFEVALLEDFIATLPSKKNILVGYSYGGPIVLASKKEHAFKILLAPALYSEMEPTPWVLKFYQWKATRWLVPKIWEAAAKEKITHKKELQKLEQHWHENQSNVLSIHGDNDWIVPYDNSLSLKSQLPKEQLKILCIKNSGHGLVWRNFDRIKQEILKTLHSKEVTN